MSDHDFEKQVRQKLNDLRISPSATLWENIEHGIRAGRRRKTPVLWLSLLLLAVTAGGYWMLDKSKPGNTKTSENSKATNSASNDVVSNNDLEPSTAPLDDKRNKTEEIENSGEQLTDRIKKANSIAHKTRSGETSRTNNGISKSLTNYPHNNITPQPADVTTASIGFKELQPRLLKVSTTFDNYDKVHNLAPELPSGEIAGLVKAPAVSVTPVKKWSFGVNGFAGMSTMNDGNLFNTGNTQVADPTRNAGAISTFAPSYTPSTISPGLSYAAGLFVKRTLNKKFSLTSGINYLHLNTKHNVGKRIFGALAVNVGNSRYQFVNNAFVIAQGETKNYTNIYHFIEVPLVMNMKLNRSPKYPVNWNAGVAYSRLLSSNSLLFDGSSGLYYSNDNLLNKSHAALITGFDVSLFSKTKTPLAIGPVARYNVSKLLNENIPENKNFLSLGLDVKLFLR